MDQGSTDSVFSEVTSYGKTSFAMTHTVTFATDGIVTGNIYTFRFYATNEKGSSDYSEYLSVAAIDPPGQANVPIVNYNLSSRNSIFVSWVLNSDGLGDGGAIQGYKLYMDDGYGGELKVVFDTVGYSSQINEFLAVNLTASLSYRFQVEPYNYNLLSPGPKSEISEYFACDMPVIAQRPSKVSTSTSTIEINWNEPVDNGGCSIQGYSVHIDDGESGDFIEANADNDQSVRLQPSLTHLMITKINALNVGKTYRIKLKAYNYAGVSESPILGVILASLPEKPPVPTEVQ